MSFFIVGVLELDIESRSSRAFEYSKILAKLALSHSYSMQMHYNFEDPFYRSTLDPIYQSFYTDSSNLIEFEVSDSPLENSFDTGLWEAIQDIQRSTSNETVPKTTLFTFLSELWFKPFVKSGVFTFSYGPTDYESLNNKVFSFNEMITDFLSCLYNTRQQDPKECYFIKK